MIMNCKTQYCSDVNFFKMIFSNLNKSLSILMEIDQQLIHLYEKCKRPGIDKILFEKEGHSWRTYST